MMSQSMIRNGFAHTDRLRGTVELVVRFLKMLATIDAILDHFSFSLIDLLIWRGTAEFPASMKE